MGVIKDGTVSGVLPASEVFAVNYPGYPSNISRAVETLGGTEGIAEARSSEELKTLELRFRPEDPYSHPVVGKLQSCSNFLLKISKKTCSVRNTGNIGSPSTDLLQGREKASVSGESLSGNRVDEPEMKGTSQDRGENESKTEVCAEIVARVSQEYCFDGMADYQHVLAVHADAAQKKKRKWADMDPYVKKSGIIDLDRDDLLMLVPPFFSAKDTPEQVVLKPSSTGSSTKKNILQQLTNQHSSEIKDRTFFVDFNVEDVPKKIEWEKSTPPSYLFECQTAVCKLFDERPIWPKPSLAECLRDADFRITNIMMRRLLVNAAYYFSNGPFLKFWIRRGYDPRKDPGSCIYQRLDFRVPPSLRGYCDANDVEKYKQRWEDLCAFKCFPYGCQLSLQLFELDDDYIQEQIKKPVKDATCSRTSGWFSSRMVNHFRLRIAVRFLAVCPEPEATKLLKTFKSMFEKSKRRLIFEGDSRPDKTSEEGVCEPQDEEIADQEARNEILSEEEEENEEADVELDDYEEYEEALGVSGDEEDEIPLEPSAYNNSSTNYLQNIFNAFPSAEPGSSRVPDIDGSDGEYQIYEPFDDSDDDSDNG